MTSIRTMISVAGNALPGRRSWRLFRGTDHPARASQPLLLRAQRPRAGGRLVTAPMDRGS